MKPILVIHGGAWAMPDDGIVAHERGIGAALAAGWSALERGGSAVDAVEAAITVMEDDDTFDAGRGSFLTRDGRVQLDALLMNGADLRSGGVACVERLRNPIQAARLVLDKSPHVYFVGTGAERFAVQNGMGLVANTELIVPREPIMKLVLGKWASGRWIAWLRELLRRRLRRRRLSIYTRGWAGTAASFCWGRMGGLGWRTTRREWRGAWRRARGGNSA